MTNVAALGDRHTRTVFWLKIILPLIALAILSTLFLVSRNIGGEGTIPFSDVDLDALAREQRLTAPEYSALTKDGSALTVRGQSARPTENGAEASGLAARYEAPDGQTIELSAAAGRFDETGGTLTLSGGVRINTSTGYVLTTDSVEARLDATSVSGPGPVAAEAPFGTVNAGAFAVTRDDASGSGTTLGFKNGVRMVYRPARMEP